MLLYGVGTILFLAAGGSIIGLNAQRNYGQVYALGSLLIISGLLFAIGVVISILNHRSTPGQEEVTGQQQQEEKKEESLLG